MAAGDRDEPRGSRPRFEPLGRVRNCARSRCTEWANAAEFGGASTGTSLTMEPNRDPHLPGASLWPIGLAIGIACVLVGIVISWIVAVVGAAIAVFCATLWIRDSTRGYSTPPADVQPETRPGRPTDGAPPADELGPAMPVMSDEE